LFNWCINVELWKLKPENRTFCWKYHWRKSIWTRAVESWAKRQRGSKGTSLDEAVRQLYAPYLWQDCKSIPQCN